MVSGPRSPPVFLFLAVETFCLPFLLTRRPFLCFARLLSPHLCSPSDQFLNQEPGDNDEILNCLKYVRPGGGFVPTFQMMSKIEVNGAKRSPIYEYLTDSCPATNSMIGDVAYFIMWNPLRTSDITWNFEKVLVGRDGKPIKRYNSATPPKTIENDILQVRLWSSVCPSFCSPQYPGFEGLGGDLTYLDDQRLLAQLQCYPFASLASPEPTFFSKKHMNALTKKLTKWCCARRFVSIVRLSVILGAWSHTITLVGTLQDQPPGDRDLGRRKLEL
jgi:glutathione peroxidase-family protein